MLQTPYCIYRLDLGAQFLGGNLYSTLLSMTHHHHGLSFGDLDNFLGGISQFDCCFDSSSFFHSSNSSFIRKYLSGEMDSCPSLQLPETL